MKSKKQSKSSNNSTTKTEVAKNAIKECDKTLVMEDYFDCNVRQDKPLTQNALIKLCDDMAKEIEQDETITSITMYLRKHGVNRRTWQRWVTIYPYVFDTNDLCKEIIADRNQKKIHDDFRYIHMVQVIYDDIVYAKGVKFHSDLKKQEDQGKGDITVILDGVPITGLVKPKDDNGNNELV